MNLVTPNRNFAFAAYAMVLGQGGGDLVQSVELQKQLPVYRVYPGNERILRSAVNAGTTLDAGWASDLSDYQQVDAAFQDSMRPYSLFDAAFPYAAQLPLKSRIALTSGGLEASGVTEGVKKAVRRLTFSVEFLAALRVAVFIIASDELLRFGHSAGLQLLDRELRGGVVDGTNAEFTTFLAADSTATPSSGNILADLAVALAAISTTGRGRFFAACSPLVATQLATMPGAGGEQAFPGFTPAGGVISGVQFIPCAVPTDSTGSALIVVDATQLALGADVVTLAASKQTNIQLDDDPGAGASDSVSMFQTDSIAWRVERSVGWSKLFPTASAVITGADYSVAS